MLCQITACCHLFKVVKAGHLFRLLGRTPPWHPHGSKQRLRCYAQQLSHTLLRSNDLHRRIISRSPRSYLHFGLARCMPPPDARSHMPLLQTGVHTRDNQRSVSACMEAWSMPGVKEQNNRGAALEGRLHRAGAICRGAHLPKRGVCGLLQHNRALQTVVGSPARAASPRKSPSRQSSFPQ